MENELENGVEEGMTLGEICRIVFKRIWYVLGASVLAAVVAVLVFVFAVNPHKVTYSGDYQVSYPLSDTQKYPNGAPFFYNDIMSNASLKAVVASDEQLSGIDVDKLLKKDGVTFVAEIDEDSKLYTGKYSIRMKGSYFSDYDQAVLFAKTIADTFVIRINDSAQSVSYEIDPALFANASYEMQLKSLADQKTRLLAEADRWISVYHESYCVNGKTLKNIRTEIEGVYGDTARKLLETDLERCGYVPLGEVENKKKQISEEIAYNELQMAALEKAMETMGGAADQPAAQSRITAFAAGDGSSDAEGDDSSKWVINIQAVSDLMQQYATYVSRNEQLRYQMTQLTEANINAFAASVMTQYTRLSEKADMLAQVVAQIYRENSRVFAGQEELHRDGETNVIFVGVAVFVVAFLLAALVVFCVDSPKYKQKKLQLEAAQAEASEKPEPKKDETNE